MSPVSSSTAEYYSVLGLCVIRNWMEAVLVQTSDPGSAHLILKVDHCRLN